MLAGMASGGGAREPEPALVLYTRAGCHLCELMKSELEAAGLARPGSLREVDVDRAPELRERFGAVVPVLAIGGRVAFRGRIRPGTLRRRFARLAERHRRAGPGALEQPDT
jgi:hypothetical protein